MILTSWDGYKWLVDKPPTTPKELADILVLSRQELSVLKTLYILAEPGLTFVDVGAHVGYYAIRMSRHYKHVHAFEPNPEYVEKLKQNQSLNSATNITIHPYALGDKEGEKTLCLASASSTLISPTLLSRDVRQSITGRVVVKVKRMDEVIEEADVVKIDAEGYELNVLLGMQGIIRNRKPSIIIEHHEFRGYNINTLPQIKRLLKIAGYIPLPLGEYHILYYHRDRPAEKITYPIYRAWVNRCIENIRQGRAWYFGLPYAWWWGMSFADFIEDLPNHIPKESDWLRLLNQD